MHVRPHTPAPPGNNSWGAPAQILRCAALCCLQLVDVPELEEEGKEDLTRRVRGWAILCNYAGMLLAAEVAVMITSLPSALVNCLRVLPAGLASVK